MLVRARTRLIAKSYSTSWVDKFWRPFYSNSLLSTGSTKPPSEEKDEGADNPIARFAYGRGNTVSYESNILNTVSRQLLANRAISTKKMLDSYSETILRFKSDTMVREDYINFKGHIRFDKILEDMDILAATIAYKHAGVDEASGPPLAIVTASVDRINLLRHFNTKQDVKLSGHVTYVGRSSMEVTMKAEMMHPSVNTEQKSAPALASTGNTDDTILVARFTMVATNPITKRPCAVNTLEIVTEEEKELCRLGEESKRYKQESILSSLSRQPPTVEERLIIHDLYLKNLRCSELGRKPDHIIWMEDTKLQSVHVTQPQVKNVHNFVFGGHLMQLATELAFATGCQFIKKQPEFLAIDGISFRKSVPIGSILKFKSQVTYAKPKSFQVSVQADVIDFEQSKEETTNVFNFSMGIPDLPYNHITQPLEILPKSYAESMQYLEGRRLLDKGRVMAEKEQTLLRHEY